MPVRLSDQVTPTLAGVSSRVRPRATPSADVHRSPADRILALQRAYGNASVQRLIQFKLAVSQPGDPYEVEAERVAEAVTQAVDRPPSAAVAVDRKHDVALTISRLCNDCSQELHRASVPEDERDKQVMSVQRQPEEDKDTKDLVSRAPDGDVGEVDGEAETAIRGLPGGGRPLSPDVRADMESRVGFDFGPVRVHTDGGAGQLARAMNARAFTVGSDIVFGSGEYSPGTKDGQKLLAHELTHVVQQTGPVQRQGEER